MKDTGEKETHPDKSKQEMFEQLLTERKKSQWFIGITVAAVIVAVGTLVYALQPVSDETPQTTGPGGQVMMGGGSGGSGGARIIPTDDITKYLNDDGSVNTEAVNDELASKQGPPTMMEAMRNAREDQIDEALEAGDITKKQADALKEAWGID